MLKKFLQLIYLIKSIFLCNKLCYWSFNTITTAFNMYAFKKL